MNSLYTKSVDQVPSDYVKASPAYHRNLWFALAGLLVFFLGYFFLTAWFFYISYRMFYELFYVLDYLYLKIIIGLLFFALGCFMIAGILMREKPEPVVRRRLCADEEPLLFDFLHKLADEIGAPRPDKVYLSNAVNASVEYDQSLLNLLRPSRKNLDIGCGLVNVLNLGEFKAVLGHEFGHFAQKSMLVGRWVYTARQIAMSLVNGRMWMATAELSPEDQPILVYIVMYVGRALIWAVRAIVEGLFFLVYLSDLALRREMEFQADLVSVSATGSDALINALHRLQAGDSAFEAAVNHLQAQIQAGYSIENLYAIQSNAIVKLSEVIDDASYGQSPVVPTLDASEHRVFQMQIAQAPAMWSTHPPNYEREENAKRRYLRGHIDERSSWDLFQHPEELQKQMTRDVYEGVKFDLSLQANADTIAEQNKGYEKIYYHPRYKGVYLQRFISLTYDTADEMANASMSFREVERSVELLYPSSLSKHLEAYQTVMTEHDQLLAIQEGYLHSSSRGKEIYHRGQQISKSELPEVLEDLKAEAKDLADRFAAHDRLSRSVHLRLAEQRGNDWAAYLKGLHQLIHFAEHNLSNLFDAQSHAARTIMLMPPIKKWNDADHQRVGAACNELHRALFSLDENRDLVQLDQEILKRLEVENWSTMLEPLGLGSTNVHNVYAWMSAAETWVYAYTTSLSLLHSAALELLLETEQLVRRSKEEPLPAVPESSQVGYVYPKLCPGYERELEVKPSWWMKFKFEHGLAVTLGRFVVAVALLVATSFVLPRETVHPVHPVYATKHILSIYNGLNCNVSLNVHGTTISLAPHSMERMPIVAKSGFFIQASTAFYAQIERVAPKFSNENHNYIYNIAGAGALFEYQTSEADSTEFVINALGAPIWTSSEKSLFFPEETGAFSADENATRLGFESQWSPAELLAAIENEHERNQLLRSQILWASPRSQELLPWLEYAAGTEKGIGYIKERILQFPDEVISVRALLDQAPVAEREELCNKYRELNAQRPDVSDFRYLAIRCQPGGEQQCADFVDAFSDMKQNGWLAWAAANCLITKDQWESAFKAFEASYYKVPVLKDAAVARMIRISRLLQSRGGEAHVSRNMISRPVQEIIEIGSGKSSDPYAQACYLLTQGKLVEALAQCAKEDPRSVSMQLLVAASEGASKSMVADGLALAHASLDVSAIHCGLGLALREGQDWRPFARSILPLYSSHEVDLNQFMKHLEQQEFAAADTIRKSASLEFRAHLAMLGKVAFPKDIPAEWGREARHLLWAFERPYWRK